MLFLNLVKVMEVIRAFRINALVNNKVFAIFLVNKRMRAVRASQDDFVGELINTGLKFSAADFAHKLIARAVIPVKIVFWSMTIRADGIIGNITNRAAFDRLNIIVVTPLDIFNKVFVKPNLTLDDEWRLIDFKLLILRRMRIIESPLFERDVFTNKITKIRNNFQKVLILYQ